MSDTWTAKLLCAIQCQRCSQKLAPTDPRILSVIDHEAICLNCKREEERRDDYAEISKQTIGQCMMDTEMEWSDPKGYCYHHFYPYRC
jgi:hypothetical protein